LDPIRALMQTRAGWLEQDLVDHAWSGPQHAERRAGLETPAKRLASHTLVTPELITHGAGFERLGGPRRSPASRAQRAQRLEVRHQKGPREPVLAIDRDMMPELGHAARGIARSIGDRPTTARVLVIRIDDADSVATAKTKVQRISPGPACGSVANGPQSVADSGPPRARRSLR